MLGECSRPIILYFLCRDTVLGLGMLRDLLSLIEKHGDHCGLDTGAWDRKVFSNLFSVKKLLAIELLLLFRVYLACIGLFALVITPPFGPCWPRELPLHRKLLAAIHLSRIGWAFVLLSIVGFMCVLQTYVQLLGKRAGWERRMDSAYVDSLYCRRRWKKIGACFLLEIPLLDSCDLFLLFFFFKFRRSVNFWNMGQMLTGETLVGIMSYFGECCMVGLS